MTGSPQTDPRYEFLIRENPYALHSQQCPVQRSVRRKQPGTPGTTADCNCWRKAQIIETLRAIDAADEASGVRRVTAQELADQLELARQEGKAQERLRIASFLQELLTGRIPAEPDWDRVLDMLAERLAAPSAADSPVGGVS